MLKKKTSQKTKQTTQRELENMKISILLLILYDGWHCIFHHGTGAVYLKHCTVFANMGVHSQIGSTAFQGRSQ